jgi:hypothetical protein
MLDADPLQDERGNPCSRLSFPGRAFAVSPQAAQLAWRPTAVRGTGRHLARLQGGVVTRDGKVVTSKSIEEQHEAQMARGWYLMPADLHCAAPDRPAELT